MLKLFPNNPNNVKFLPYLPSFKNVVLKYSIVKTKCQAFNRIMLDFFLNIFNSVNFYDCKAPLM